MSESRIDMPPYCKHIKGKHYGTEIDDWVDGYFKYLKSTEPWNYDFENGKEKYLENTIMNNQYFRN